MDRERQELIQWAIDNPDVGVGNEKIQLARWMKPAEVPPESLVAIQKIKDTLTERDMDSFYRVQAYNFLKKHPEIRSKNTFLRDMYGILTRGEPFVSWKQSTGLSKSVYALMTDDERKSADATRGLAEIKWVDPNEAQKKRKVLPSALVDEHALQMMIYFGDFLAENSKLLSEFVDKKRKMAAAADTDDAQPQSKKMRDIDA
jgi:hypothetical protein